MTFQFFFLYREPTVLEKNTWRCQSRALHVRDREADIDGRKNWRLLHLPRSKGEARRAEPTFGMCFRANAPKKTRAEPMLFGCGSFVEER